MPLKTCIKVIQGDVERGFLLRLLIGSAKNRTERYSICYPGKSRSGDSKNQGGEQNKKKRRLVIILRTRGFFRILPENAARQR